MATLPTPTLRGSTYYLYRRVPARYRRIDARNHIEQSLHTDSLSDATAKAIEVWNQLVGAWEAKLAGNSGDAETRFAAAHELAQRRGFRYLTAARVATLPYDELLTRLDRALGDTPGKIDILEAEALLGGAAEPPITISRALQLYWTMAKDRTLSKSEDQLRRWQNPRKKAIRNLIAVIGDKPLREISGDDMLAFREWWMDRLEDENLTSNSANKDLIHIGEVFKTVNRMKRLGIVLPLSDLSFKEGEKKKRPAFSTTWIRNVLLKSGAFATLNDQAQAITLIMINTGARPSEIAALSKSAIQLDATVPHIAIEAEGRQLKTRRSKRKIPLTGCSLEAARRFPDGFPRYRRSSATLSATVNAYMRDHNLMESPNHTMYSLRHAFEDRMLAGKFDERIRRDLFGHRLNREEYGEGASLEHMHELLQTISL